MGHRYSVWVTWLDVDLIHPIDVKNVEIKIKNVKKRKKRDKNKKRF